jgi:hypothetical protein
MVPVELLLAPTTPARLPPVQIPVMFNTPVEEFTAPPALAAVPPRQLPEMFKTPVEVFRAPSAKEPLPPITLFAVILRVPVELFLAAFALVAEPPVRFPTIDAEFPEVPEKVTHGVVPAMQFAVSVTPLDKVNPPPAVALLALSLRTSPVAPRLVETLTVMAKEFAMRTSPAANVTAEAVPLGVVAQTSEALMFPALRAK